MSSATRVRLPSVVTGFRRAIDEGTLPPVAAKPQATYGKSHGQIRVAPATSSQNHDHADCDLATNGLGVQRARVLGQILPGIPVWELGPETKYPGLPYVVFPGNVGGPDALQDAVQKLNT